MEPSKVELSPEQQAIVNFIGDLCGLCVFARHSDGIPIEDIVLTFLEKYPQYMSAIKVAAILGAEIKSALG